MRISHFTCNGFYYDLPEADQFQRPPSLADHVRERLETVDPQRTRATALAARLRDFVWLEILNDWERRFLDDTARYARLSDKQEATLWRVWAKVLAWSMRA